MPRTTAHRIVNSLEEQGYVYKARARGRYVVAPRLVELAANTLWAASTLSPAHAVLTEVAHVATGTVSLAIFQRGEVAYIDSAVSDRSEEHTSELQSLMRISYAVFCLKKKKKNH